MTRRTRPLTGDVVAGLSEPCRTCVFWERGARPRPDPDATDRVRKQAWVTDRGLRDGPPGSVLLVDGRPAGHAVHAPSRAFPRRGPSFPSPSDDAVLLATVRVDPDHRGVGNGRLLLQAAIRDAIGRDANAVEAYGDRSGTTEACVLPLDWLLREGFEVAVEHPRYPLARLELRQVVSWTSSLARAARELLQRVPVPVPQPRPSSASAHQARTAEDSARDTA